MIIQKINNMFGVIATNLSKFKTKLFLDAPLKDSSNFTIYFKWSNLGEEIFTKIRGRERSTRSVKKHCTRSSQYNFFSTDASLKVPMFNVNVVNYKFTEKASDVLDWMLGDLSHNNNNRLAKTFDDYDYDSVVKIRSLDEIKSEFDIPELNAETLSHITLDESNRFDFAIRLVNKKTKKTAKLFFNNQPDSYIGGDVPMVLFKKEYVIQKDNSIGWNGSNTEQHDKVLFYFLRQPSVSKELKKQAIALRQAKIEEYQEIRQSLADTNAIQDTLSLIEESNLPVSLNDYVKKGGRHHMFGVGYDSTSNPLDTRPQITIDHVIALWVEDGLGVDDAVSFNINLSLEHVNQHDEKAEKWINVAIVKGKKDVGYNWSALSKSIDNQGFYFDYKGTTTYVASRSRYSTRGDYRERTASKIATVHKHIKETIEEHNSGVRYTEKRRLEIAEALKEKNEGIALQTSNFHTASRDFAMLLGQSDYNFVNSPSASDKCVSITSNGHSNPTVEILVKCNVDLQRLLLLDDNIWGRAWDDATDQEKIDNYRLTISLSKKRTGFDLLITDLAGDESIMEGRRLTEMFDVSPEQLTRAVESLIKVRMNIRGAVETLQSVAIQELDEGFEVELLRSHNG